MRKRSKIILIAMIIVAVLMIFFYLTSLIKGKSITGEVSLSLETKNQITEKQFLDIFIEGIIDIVNSDEKYTQFIKDSKYDSAELIIDKVPYYLEYDYELNKVTIGEPDKKADFKIKITKKKFNKIFDSIEKGNLKEAGLKLINSLPRKVKLNLFKQCMTTEWCKQGNF